MKIHEEIIQAFLRGDDLEKYKEHWIYRTAGQGEEKNKTVFALPDPAKRDTAAEIYEEVVACVRRFEPYNLPLWNALIPDWPDLLDRVDVHLIAGLPEPNDATVLPGPDGTNAIILDLACWTQYAGSITAEELARNIVTHEGMHICIGSRFPQIDRDYEQGSYRVQLDSLVFNEGFAHLVSYSPSIDETDWTGGKLPDIKRHSLSVLKKALGETDGKKQAVFLHDAVFGDYYSKFGCMIGMLYLADLYRNGGMDGLQREFSLGYPGIVDRILQHYEAEGTL